VARPETQRGRRRPRGRALSAARKRTEALGAMEMGSGFKQASAKLVIALTNWSESL
jgi:hypothetical protein